MPRLAKLRPSPSMVVALLALAVALSGTVYAAVKIDGREVRKGSLPGNRIKANSVGGGQVNEALLGAVPQATTATTAANAAFAAEAANAASAESLSGFTSDAFSRVDRDGDGDDAIAAGGVSGAGTAASVTMAAPQDGFLLAIASGAVQTTADVSDAFTCILRVNDVDQGTSRRGGEIQTPRVAFGERVCATNVVAQVAGGLHDIDFNFSDLGANTFVDEAELNVVFIPLQG